MAKILTTQSNIEAYLRRSVRVGAVEVARPLWGRHSEVFLLTAADGTRSVLRAFAFRSQSATYAATLDQLGGKGLPLPEILWCDDSLATWLRHRRAFCVEQFAHGKLMVDAGTSDATLGALLSSLARLHDEQSAKSGPPSKLQDGDYAASLRAECLRHLRSIPEKSPLLRAGDRQRWRALISATHEKLPPIARFSLCHGKLGTDDIVISADRRSATFIDLEGLNFTHFAHDLMSVVYDIAGVPVGEEMPLIEQYLRARRNLEIGEYTGTMNFFAVRHHLRKLAVAHRRTKHSELRNHRRANFHYAALVERAHGI